MSHSTGIPSGATTGNSSPGPDRLNCCTAAPRGEFEQKRTVVAVQEPEFVGENVEEEPPDELLGEEGHDLLLIVVVIVPSLELPPWRFAGNIVCQDLDARSWQASYRSP